MLTKSDNLFVERNEKREQLFPETSEIFFRKGSNVGFYFGATQSGKVGALIDPRNNENVVWSKKS